MKMNRLTRWIGIAMVLGVAVGYACNTMAGSPEAARRSPATSASLTDIFLRLIKMIIAPPRLRDPGGRPCRHGRLETVGRIGAKALGWFVMASCCRSRWDWSSPTCSQPGSGLGVSLPEVGSAVGS